MPTFNKVDMMDCSNGFHDFAHGSECRVCGHVDETIDPPTLKRKETTTMTLEQRLRRIRDHVHYYLAELDAQAISPNGDDFNRLADDVLHLVEGWEPKPLRISPANR